MQHTRDWYCAGSSRRTMSTSTFSAPPTGSRVIRWRIRILVAALGWMRDKGLQHFLPDRFHRYFAHGRLVAAALPHRMVHDMHSGSSERLDETAGNQAVVRADQRDGERAGDVSGAAVETDEEVQLVHHRRTLPKAERPGERGDPFGHQARQLLRARAVFGPAEQEKVRPRPAPG